MTERRRVRTVGQWISRTRIAPPGLEEEQRGYVDVVREKMTKERLDGDRGFAVATLKWKS